VCGVLGVVYDETKNYDNSFHVGGVMLSTGGLLVCLLHLPQLRRFTAKADLVHTDTESVSTELPVPGDDGKNPHGTRFHSDVKEHGNKMTLMVRGDKVD